MTATTKTRKRAKKAAPAVKLPGGGETQVQQLPRGQELLPNGMIRLKSGTHDLGRESKTYDVAGVSVELSGNVLVASKDVDWLSIGKCQKCSTDRPSGILLTKMADGSVVLQYTCSNKKSCDLGGRTYIQVHSPGRFIITE